MFERAQPVNCRDVTHAVTQIEALPTEGADAMQFYAARTPITEPGERALLVKEQG